MERFPLKLAVVTHIVPPATVGTAMRMYRLFRDAHPDDYCLLISRDYEEAEGDQDLQGRLPAKHYRLPSEWCQLRPPALRRLAPFFDMVNVPLRVYQRARNIERIVKQEKCGAILAFSGDLIDLPAGYLASRRCRIPFYAAVDDYYSYQWPDRFGRRFARYAEPVVLKGSARVIVLNDFLRDEYCRRYHINPVVIYNPCELPVAAMGENVPWPATDGEVAIVYTGAIYHAHYDAFANIIAAIGLLCRPDVKLHLYTAQSRRDLERRGIQGPVVFHGHLPPSEILGVQQQADILFLPLAFETSIPEVIKTSAPFKMGEYLASGRPILVHAPADSFVSWYFKTHECGVVVDQSDPRMLVQAIQCILNDAELRRKLSRNAQSSAQIDFGLQGAQVAFRRVFHSEDDE